MFQPKKRLVNRLKSLINKIKSQNKNQISINSSYHITKTFSTIKNKLLPWILLSIMDENNVVNNDQVQE